MIIEPNFFKDSKEANSACIRDSEDTWSPEARKAAIESRRAKAKGKQQSPSLSSDPFLQRHSTKHDGQIKQLGFSVISRKEVPDLVDKSKVSNVERMLKGKNGQKYRAVTRSDGKVIIHQVATRKTKEGKSSSYVWGIGSSVSGAMTALNQKKSRFGKGVVFNMPSK